MDGFDINKNTWDPAGKYPNIPRGGGYGIVKNSATGDIWTNGLAKWTAASNTWSSPITRRAPVGVRFPYAFDGKRGQLFGLNFGDGQGYGEKTVSAGQGPVNLTFQRQKMFCRRIEREFGCCIMMQYD